jgi:hypothetical protein
LDIEGFREKISAILSHKRDQNAPGGGRKSLTYKAIKAIKILLPKV